MRAFNQRSALMLYCSHLPVVVGSYCPAWGGWVLLGVQLTQNRAPFSRVCRAPEKIPSSKVPQNRGKAEPSSEFWFRHRFLPHNAQSRSLSVPLELWLTHLEIIFSTLTKGSGEGKADFCLMSPWSGQNLVWEEWSSSDFPPLLESSAPIARYLLEKSVQGLCWYHCIQKKAPWISDLDWKMWDECFLQIIQTRCGVQGRENGFQAKQEMRVCVSAVWLYSGRRNSAEWSLGKIFFYCPVLKVSKGNWIHQKWYSFNENWLADTARSCVSSLE